MSSTFKVAVTGGSGRIGSEVCKQLAERGHTVINIDRRQHHPPVAKFVFCDVLKREQLQPVLEQVDAVCHLGEITNTRAAPSPEIAYYDNARAAGNVLQTAADLGLKRVIYTSSCQAYGFFGGEKYKPQVLPFDETHPLQPHNPYALSKASNERFCKIVSDEYNLSVAIFRLPGTFGFHASDEWFRWIEHDTGRMDELGIHLHVTDAARAYVLAIENPRPGCEAYHFSAKEVFSGVPLRERLLKHHPDYPPLPEDWPAFKSPMLTCKARDHFGWEAQWNFLDLYRQKFGRDPNG